uniref:(northern house mosquito) hypothetical protein n=1 Tax=Culex pipiens TaxID=7175 RepID=A0A8D8IRU7_CULPI
MHFLSAGLFLGARQLLHRLALLEVDPHAVLVSVGRSSLTPDGFLLITDPPYCSRLMIDVFLLASGSGLFLGGPQLRSATPEVDLQDPLGTAHIFSCSPSSRAG